MALGGGVQSPFAIEGEGPCAAAQKYLCTGPLGGGCAALRRCGPGQVLEKGGAHLAAVPFHLQKLADNSVPLLLSFYPLLGLLADLLAFLIPDVGEGIPNLPAALLAFGELIPQPRPVLPHGLHVMELVYGLSIPSGQAANGPVISYIVTGQSIRWRLYFVLMTR